MLGIDSCCQSREWQHAGNHMCLFLLNRSFILAMNFKNFFAVTLNQSLILMIFACLANCLHYKLLLTAW